MDTLRNRPKSSDLENYGPSGLLTQFRTIRYDKFRKMEKTYGDQMVE